MTGKPEIRQNFLQVADIRRGDEARQEIDRAGRLAAFGQLLHHRLDRGVKAFHVGAAVAGGRDRDDRRQPLPGQLLSSNSRTSHGHVVADGLGQAGGGDADEAGSYLAMTFMRPA